MQGIAKLKVGEDQILDPVTPTPDHVNHWVRRVSGIAEDADSDLFQAIEKELRRLASIHLRKERKNHTLQTTALVNEAYLRLTGNETPDCNDRNHFLAVASKVMRQILIDYARSRNTHKRRPEKVNVEYGQTSLSPIEPRVLDVDMALNELALIAPRQAELVELHFFGGLSLEEAASVLKISARTADKDWALARAWLRHRLDPR